MIFLRSYIIILVLAFLSFKLYCFSINNDDFSHINALHNLLQDKSFDKTKILSLLDDIEDKSLLDLPVGSSEIPFGHFLLNKYFVSSDVNVRKDIIEILIKAIKYGMNVDIGFNNDPHLIFKSIAIRELDLTNHLTNSSNFITTDILNNPSIISSISQIFKMLYALPCEPVPLMKLLLHADNIIRYKPNNYKDYENIKRLLISASLGTNSKPTAKTNDLILYSKSYNNILHNLGHETNDGIYLYNIIISLDELGNQINKNLLLKFHLKDNNINLFHLFIQIFLYVDNNNRTPLHHLAISGSIVMLRELIQTFQYIIHSNMNDIDNLIVKLKDILLMKDNRELKAYEYIALRYGIKSNNFHIINSLYNLLNITIDINHLIQLFPSVNNNTKNNCNDEICINNELSNEYKQEIIKSYENTGGWDTSILSSDISGDTNRCDIEEQWGSLPTSEEFFYKYIRTGTPVIFRGANSIDSKLRTAFTKDNFIARYGKDVVPISTIPYAGSFGIKGLQATLHEIANITDLLDKQSPMYAFSVPSQKWQHKLQMDAPIPKCLSFTLTGSTISQSNGNVEVQFYLGPKGSGAPVHFHGHAANTLAFGEKKWYLFPPSDAFYSTMPAYDFVVNDTRANIAIQCTQRSGDIMYVPTLWGHATLNIKQSIGVAHEFSVESFCME